MMVVVTVAACSVVAESPKSQLPSSHLGARVGFKASTVGEGAAVAEGMWAARTQTRAISGTQKWKSMTGREVGAMMKRRKFSTICRL